MNLPHSKGDTTNIFLHTALNYVRTLETDSNKTQSSWKSFKSEWRYLHIKLSPLQVSYLYCLMN